MKRLVLIWGIILIVGLLTALYLVSQKQIVQNQASSGQIDMLDYLVSDYAVGKSSEPKSTGITEYVTGNSQFIAKSNSQYEYITWDANNIYLKQDTSVGNFSVSGGTATSYTLSPGTWAKRFMSLGESFQAPAEVKWFDNNCRIVTTWPNWGYTITLENRTTLNLGGPMGSQNVIVVKYDYGGPSFERYYYSKTWGWVRWEEVDPKTGKVGRSATFNRVSNDFLTVKAKCGTAQPNVKIPSPSPAPSPAPPPNPSPSPSPAPSSLMPQPPQPNPSCPGTSPYCYDCNRDGTVNILDFTCFSKNYGRATE